MTYLILAAAIAAEVVATTAMKASDGFTRLVPSLVTIVGYVIALYLLSISLRTIPTGIAYAVWSGVGIVLISLIAWIVHGQKLDLPAAIGMAMIIGGIVVMNAFSRAAPH
jgi:small multidrug resistance pump